MKLPKGSWANWEKICRKCQACWRYFGKPTLHQPGEHDNLDRGEDIQVSHEAPQQVGQVGQRLDPGPSRCQLDIPLYIILSHDIPITNTSQKKNKYIPCILYSKYIPKIPSHEKSPQKILVLSPECLGSYS